ncbi:sulfurtransferase/chromate resistance protein [Sneathiella marina]|uniref:Sulfurtransferase/chromate resistance protein n=1 Tax=Sneathiella marina TaxID=2950108 RepID=A0ABY4W6S3_9PROT|nr:sulfurtransferase/chromate resistance protein [Sneathiella marina]USG62885.1 sulfurtransferase/chromate resistance protein [Sneathiella marina]
MSDETLISLEKLWSLIGTPNCPRLIDARIDEDFENDPRMIPTALRRSGFDAMNWGSEYIHGPVIIYCEKGLKLSQGAAAWLRHLGCSAESLAGGFVAWREAGLPLVPAVTLPKPDVQGRTVWVTRSRPKIDRIACPWLIRRFVDPEAVFLFVAPSEVLNVADRFGVTPFDVEEVYWSHREEKCTFDTMIEEFGLTTDPLLRLAEIVRGADTARPELAPESAGLLAASLGMSQLYGDDLAQLEKGMDLYDAFYAWARDAGDETHNWPARTGDAA